jgi:hypothetical protein
MAGHAEIFAQPMPGQPQSPQSRRENLGKLAPPMPGSPWSSQKSRSLYQARRKTTHLDPRAA